MSSTDAVPHITRLPNELLRAMLRPCFQQLDVEFSEEHRRFVAPSIDTKEAARLVCRAWNHLVEGDSRAWTNLIIHSGTQPEQLQIWLARSKEQNLRVVLFLTTKHFLNGFLSATDMAHITAQTSAFVSIVETALSRVTELRITCTLLCTSSLILRHLADAEAPRMERFVIHVTNGSAPAQRLMGLVALPLPFRAGCPNLRHVILHPPMVLWLAGPLFDHLTSLQLGFWSDREQITCYSIALADFFGVLLSAPLLTTLSFSNLQCKGFIYAGETPSLCHLLRLEIINAPSCVAVVQRLHFPRLHNLRLQDCSQHVLSRFLDECADILPQLTTAVLALPIPDAELLSEFFIHAITLRHLDLRRMPFDFDHMASRWDFTMAALAYGSCLQLLCLDGDLECDATCRFVINEAHGSFTQDLRILHYHHDDSLPTQRRAFMTTLSRLAHGDPECSPVDILSDLFFDDYIA
ncbi:hypothetical protein C8R43DRAFT_1136139 [Mycena crocata]|nr:hypothetical protein C8R43DRAFT_1136139 [Mycena crocata]